MSKGPNRANVNALGRVRNAPRSAIARARGNQRRRGQGPGGTFAAVGRLRNRPANLTADMARAQANVRRNVRRRARAR